MKIELELTVRFVNPDTDKILKALTKLGDKIMATQAALAADLAEVKDQIAKIGTETQGLLQKIADLTAAVENAGQTTPEVDAAMAALKAQAKVVDDLVADTGGDVDPVDPA